MTRKKKTSLFREMLSETGSRYRDFLLHCVFRKQRRKPWMRRREVLVIEDLLKRLEPRTCLEWGAGYSTLCFPALLTDNFRWISIEHEEEWSNKISEMNQKENVEIHFVQSDPVGQLESYVEFPAKFGKFDFILVDGRARSSCVTKAHELAENDGVVVLHDANREQYQEPLKIYRHQEWFNDWRVMDCGLWIGSKGRDIREILDLDRHRRLWKTVRKIGRVLGL